jgi:1,4-dihydroxy-2-naphthoate octaprenyltransferase
MTTKLILYPNTKLWMAAIKPPMYSVAIMPIWVGTAVAFAETKIIHVGVFSTFLTAAILILAWENLSNDVFDSETGIDKNKKHSLVNLTGNKSLIFWLGNLFLCLGLLGILAIAWWQQDLTVIGLILLCCALGYSYQGPPLRLGYQGLGEIICFFCFGPLGVAAAYYSQTQTWSQSSLAASVVVGIATSLILFCSHFHQVKDDLAAGKRSPIVRLGTATAAQLLPWFGGSIYPLTAVFVILGVFPIWTLLIWASLPAATKLFRHVKQYHNQPEKVSNCKFIAVAVHFWSGLSAGIRIHACRWLMQCQFEFRPYRRRFKPPLQTSHGTWDVRDGIILCLTAETGSSCGEIAPISWFGSETIEQALDFCRQLPAEITGETIFSIPDNLPACQFGFESAWEGARGQGTWGQGTRGHGD